MTKQEIIDELARLYRLREEGKNVDSLIIEMERRLCELIDCDKQEE